MICRFFFLMLIAAATAANAQEFPSELWHKGMVVLVNEDTISGKIKYNLEKDLIQVEANKKLYTYSSKKVFYFQIFDETVDSYREFYALPYTLVDQYKSEIFFEVLVEGKLTLLCREAIATRTVNDNISPYGSPVSYSRNVLVYTYYFLDSKGKITKYTMKKRDLLKVLSSRAAKIEEYMRVNRLRADKRYDLSRIISFYNGII
ncbi:hypothetical protein MNBD_BACTEROID06-746 [hydrothermal vent metagenome]|uniref:Uncharacterized protein n=1 Tax=hydrothermal vent metagenome TaxID=652676 RepID=A0A3B0UM97_9ZZZZ